jgi:predicted metal-dependent hydrolase
MKERIEIKKKKVKNINLRVKRDGTVHLTVPMATSEEFINRFIESKKDWIESKLNYFNERYKETDSVEIVSGESVRYLGNSYKLKVIQDLNEGLKLCDEYIEIHVNDKNDITRKQEILHKWYVERAKDKFLELVNKYEEVLNEQVNGIRIKTMKTRWGSCNVRTKNINLNLELIKKPQECIEYVVLHELAHLKHPNHSKQFWEYVGMHMPDWKLRKKKL